ncbi:hypothetical protein ANANG_G00048660 [Anguilla anguilla]|uniref:Uncharacterized protein n=1 Tax=Anguilla anguilla TaxID=7936 RepID=A0A9D3MUY7_ANGAN|nr:hypothetical protein ANANG_G00048660 [Anguilla anguilla]
MYHPVTVDPSGPQALTVSPEKPCMTDVKCPHSSEDDQLADSTQHSRTTSAGSGFKLPAPSPRCPHTRPHPVKITHLDKSASRTRHGGQGSLALPPADALARARAGERGRGGSAHGVRGFRDSCRGGGSERSGEETGQFTERAGTAA